MEATPAAEGARRTPFSDAELDEFRAILDKKRASAHDEIDEMRQQLADGRESDSDTAYSMHMADAGTDAAEREKLYLMLARQQKYMGYLDRALKRIDNKTYGVCKVTGKPIAKERLRAVPHTEISMDAKVQEQKDKART